MGGYSSLCYCSLGIVLYFVEFSANSSSPTTRKYQPCICQNFVRHAISWPRHNCWADKVHGLYRHISGTCPPCARQGCSLIACQSQLQPVILFHNKPINTLPTFRLLCHSSRRSFFLNSFLLFLRCLLSCFRFRRHTSKNVTRITKQLSI